MSEIFVGRDMELGLLRDALAEAADGRGGFVLVAGEAGIGKSRLADEFAQRAAADGALVAWGRCWELGGAPAYWPWTDALRAIAAERAGDDISELGQLLGELSAHPGAAAEHADAARFRLFDAVVRFLRAASSTRRLVVVIEDLHAADEPSLLLLDFVVRATATMPVLVVATYRDFAVAAGGAFAHTLGELMRARTTRRIVLVGLNAHQVGEVLEATTGLDTTSDVEERVRDYTEGNPLYVREVARLLAAEGRLPEIGDRLAVPRDVREALLMRIRMLPDDTCDVLTLAAVMGREFSIDHVVRLRGTDGAAQFEPAMSAGLVVAVTPGRLRFTHAVVSEALYDATSPTLVRELHLQVAETLERLSTATSDAHLATVAHHYLRALPLGSPRKAVDTARRAANAAVARLAYEEGARLYEMAVEAAGDVDDPVLYARLLLGLGDAQGRAGDTAAARTTFFAAAEHVREIGDPEMFAEAALGYAGRFVWMRAAQDTRLVPLLREALERLPATDSLARVRLLARLAGATRDDASREPRDALSREAVEIAERLGDADAQAYAIASRFCAIWGPDAVAEQTALAARAIAIAEQLPERERLGEALWISLLAHVTTGAMDTAREIAVRYRQLGEELSQPSIRWYATVMQSILLLMEGRLAQVEEVADAARDRGRHVQAWDSDVSHRLATVMLRWEQRRLGEVEADIRDALTEFPGYRVFRCFLALCYLETGRTDDARALTRELLAGGEEALPRDTDWLAAMTILAEVASRSAMTDVAQPLYDALLPFRALVGAAGGEPITGSLERPLGQLALLLGDDELARDHFEHALDAHTRMRAELWVAHSEVDLAGVRARSREAGAAARADHLYAQARRRAESLGLAAVAARVDAATVPTARRGGLTKREAEVAALVAAGATNREIADKLVLSERTAETHVQNILTKLGFSARTQIAAWATANGTT